MPKGVNISKIIQKKENQWVTTIPLELVKKHKLERRNILWILEEGSNFSQQLGTRVHILHGIYSDRVDALELAILLERWKKRKQNNKEREIDDIY